LLSVSAGFAWGSVASIEDGLDRLWTGGWPTLVAAWVVLYTWREQFNGAGSARFLVFSRWLGLAAPVAALGFTLGGSFVSNFLDDDPDAVAGALVLGFGVATFTVLGALLYASAAD
jgi:hypothetical protein